MLSMVFLYRVYWNFVIYFLFLCVSLVRFNLVSPRSLASILFSLKLVSFVLGSHLFYVNNLILLKYGIGQYVNCLVFPFKSHPREGKSTWFKFHNFEMALFPGVYH